MAYKPMERYFTSCVIGKMQIKTVRHHYTHENSQTPGHCQHEMLARTWSNRKAHSSLLECRMVQLLGKTVVVSYQAKYYCHHMIQQSYDLVFTQRSYKHVHMELCIRMFTATVFLIAKTWKPPRYPSR